MKYAVKPEKHYVGGPTCCADVNMAEKEHYPTITVPASRKMVEALKAGKSAKVTLTGDITTLRIIEGKDSDRDRTEFQMEVREVVTDASNEFSDMVDAVESDD